MSMGSRVYDSSDYVAVRYETSDVR